VFVCCHLDDPHLFLLSNSLTGIVLAVVVVWELRISATCSRRKPPCLAKKTMKLNFRNFFRSEQAASPTPGAESEKKSTSGALKNVTSDALSRQNNTERENYSNTGDEDDNEDEDDGDIFVVNEHERWRNDLGWSHRNLEIGDPKRYVSKLHQSDSSREAALPTGWQFVGPWFSSYFLSSAPPNRPLSTLGRSIRQCLDVMLVGSMPMTSVHSIFVKTLQRIPTSAIT
jgi:hypothetical protein